MKKAIQLLRPSKVGPLGTLLLILIYVLVHAIALIFQEYKVLPLFYGIVFLVILVNVLRTLIENLKVTINVRD